MATSPSMELVAFGVRWVVVIQDVNLPDFNEFNWKLGCLHRKSRLEVIVCKCIYIYIYVYNNIYIYI